MSLLAMIGLVFGGLAAAGLLIVLDRLRAESRRSNSAAAPNDTQAELPDETPPPPEVPPVALQEKPVIALLQASDVIRTLGGILGAAADVTRLGWPTLRPAPAQTDLLNAFAGIRASLGRRAADDTMPVAAMIGAGTGDDRSIAALNFALAAAREGARVLLIDADQKSRSLSQRAQRLGGGEASQRGWLSIGSKASRAIVTANGVAILPVADASTNKAVDAIRTAIAQARKTGGYDLVILDGPALPWSADEQKILDSAVALIAVLPASQNLDESLDAIIAALGGTERKLAGVVVNELDHPVEPEQRSRQYA
jgi:Mrp family chromosome partitioning ATPase